MTEPTAEVAVPDRRERLHRTIDGLVRLRQDVVVSYCRLVGVSSFAPVAAKASRIDPERLRRFCQIMVDYTAMGHFELYQRIIEGRERRQAVRSVAEEVYPAIANTTDFLVDFNDKYDDFDGSTGDDDASLSRDLSRLGEVITERGELEDRLLAALRR